MKIRISVVAILTLLLSVLVFTTVANAQTFRNGQSPTVASGEVIDGSAFITGASVDVSGKINGDLYCAGQNVTISGEVDGDVLCAAQNIHLTGTVSGDVRLMGQSVTIDGTVGKSATLAGQTISVERQGRIGQDITLAGQNITLDGAVVRDVIIGAGVATVDAPIGRNITANVATLDLKANTVVGGSIDYTSPQKYSKAEGASIAGKVVYTQAEQTKSVETNAYNPIGMILWSLMLIASALIFVLLFPRLLHRTTDASAASFPRAIMTVLVGLVAGIVMPFVILLLTLTIFGIPFAFVLFLGWSLVLALSGVFAAYYTGRVIWKKQNNAVVIMLVGAVVIAFLLVVPILNILVALLCTWYGSGAILMQLRGQLVTPKYDMVAPRKRKK